MSFARAGVKDEPELNPAQNRAASTLEGPVLVVAGAGTGKTHTLVHRLVRLVDSGVEPESILLLTFTRRAAEEMIARASAILGRREPVAGGTFHSFANRMLRHYGRAVGIPPDFTILDQSDSFEVLSGIRTDLRTTITDANLPRRETIAAILSKSVNKQVHLEDVLADEYPQFFELASHLEVIHGRYEKYKAERNLVDFDGLLVLLSRLLEESPEARKRIEERYRYVMVDEYQDTNVLQARITHLLAGESRNVMVVGDDAQSIYAFRGACHRNLFDFEASFDDVSLVTLEENYRSTQAILEVANGLMAQMSEAFRKRLRTERGKGERPLLVEAMDEEEQARFMTDEIERLRKEGVPFPEMAVLFRASRHAFALEVELGRRGIRYVKYGGFRFMESAHIKDVLAHLRLVAFPGDEVSLRRVLLLREGIGKTTAQRILTDVERKDPIATLSKSTARGKVRKSLQELTGLLGELGKARAQPARCLEVAIEAYEPILKTRFDDWPRRSRDLEALVELCRRYRSLRSMLADLTLEPPTASRNQGLFAGENGEGDLVLSTMHSAKGLEWRVVFVIQARDGYIPMIPGFGDEPEPEVLDEELRLLYVAVTRAKDELTIVWPRETSRSRYTWPMPSRFLTALPEGVLEHYRAAERLA